MVAFPRPWGERISYGLGVFEWPVTCFKSNTTWISLITAGMWSLETHRGNGKNCISCENPTQFKSWLIQEPLIIQHAIPSWHWSGDSCTWKPTKPADTPYIPCHEGGHNSALFWENKKQQIKLGDLWMEPADRKTNGPFHWVECLRNAWNIQNTSKHNWAATLTKQTLKCLHATLQH